VPIESVHDCGQKRPDMTACTAPAPVEGRADHMSAGAIRTAVAGVLMGTANLIPGVSGGTMVLALGVYEEFIGAVADITALRFSFRRLFFLGVLGISAAGAIFGLSSVILYLLFAYPAVMFALFIGLTLGGTPTLLRLMGRPTLPALGATLLGVTAMAGIALFRFGAELPRNMLMDGVSGLVGSTTMVLPGISGSYMLLILNQYDRILGAVDDLRMGQLGALRIMIPVGVGAVVGIVALSNLLKLLLRRHGKVTLGFLLGLLLGSVLGLWPFNRPPAEKALTKRSDAQLQVYAADHGLQGAEGLAGDALVEHILMGADLRVRPPDLVAARHGEDAVRAFAEREGLEDGAALDGEALAAQLASDLRTRVPPGPTAMEAVLALLAAAAGFTMTCLMGRMGRARPPMD
jgi:putative membrane protein